MGPSFGSDSHRGKGRKTYPNGAKPGPTGGVPIKGGDPKPKGGPQRVTQGGHHIRRAPTEKGDQKDPLSRVHSEDDKSHVAHTTT